jgi:hypothetical protein
MCRHLAAGGPRSTRPAKKSHRRRPATSCRRATLARREGRPGAGTAPGSSYVGLTPAVLNTYEATIQVGSGNGNAYIATPGGVSNLAATTYTVTATSTLGHTFSINRAANGLITRSCLPVRTGGCPASGNW